MAPSPVLGYLPRRPPPHTNPRTLPFRLPPLPPFILVISLLLFGCDSSEPDLGIPASEEENYGTFRVNGTRYEGAGVPAEDGAPIEGAAYGTLREVPAPSGEEPLLRVDLAIEDHVREDSMHWVHVVELTVVGRGETGTFTPSPGIPPYPTGYLRYMKKDCTSVPGVCLNAEISQFDEFTLTIHEFNETGFVGEFAMDTEVLGGVPLSLTEGLARIRYGNHWHVP